MNLGVDATTLEANAALKSIVRRDNGAGYDEHVTQLMKTEGIEEPTPAQRQRFDRKRKKSLSNRDWVNPHDRQARITIPAECGGFTCARGTTSPNAS